MQFDVLTLFPEMFSSYINESILGRAQTSGLIKVNLHNIRDYAEGKHRITDEPPFGGGGGMVLKAEPILQCLLALDDRPQTTDDDGQSSIVYRPTAPVILMTPQGRRFSQEIVRELAQHERLTLICGRYEGIDERVREHLVTDEISLGDYVLTGGELGAMVIIDAVTRLVPGALGVETAAETDSHATGLLEGAHYAPPASWREWDVPQVLRGGDHEAIERWRREASLRRTWERRPEMLISAELTPTDKQFLATLARESQK